MLGGCATVVLAVGLAASSAWAVDVDCQLINAENIALGFANANGYSTGANASGDLIFNTQKLTTPPNGILCYRRITPTTSSRTLTFTRNETNTPVYLLAEDYVDLNQTSAGIDVSGSGPSTTYGVGYDRLGGQGGPGGSDGGSCDFIFGASQRAGAGIGPGGGGAEAGKAGGGGASVAEAGSAGTNGATGGAVYSDPTHRLLHGGSGGGCGSDTDFNPYAGGGGGGGVLVIAANTRIRLSGSASFIRSQGGGNVNHAGGGGGGVIRLISPLVDGNGGGIQVQGSAGSSCGAASGTAMGGCGGDGVVKFEAAAVEGTFLSNILPQDATYFGPEAPIFPAAAERPTLQISSVTATWDGSVDTVVPAQLNPSLHVHRNAGVFLEAPTPAQTITVTLTSNNVPHDASVNVKMNAVGATPLTATATTGGTGSGSLTWTATLSVPPAMQLGTIEAWIDNVCTAGCP